MLFQFSNPTVSSDVFCTWWKNQFADLRNDSKAQRIARVARAREMRASKVLSLSEELNKTIQTLMDEITSLRSHVPNENAEEIALIELLLKEGRKNPTIFQSKGDFSIKLVHAVLQRSQTNRPEIALLPLFKATTTPSVTPFSSRVSPGISSQDSASSLRNISSFSLHFRALQT
jgi:hypothetical protein